MASGLDISEFADASEFFAIGDADEYVLDADLPDVNNDVEESNSHTARRAARREAAAYRLAGAFGILSGSLSGLDDAIFGVPEEDALLGLDAWSFKSIKSTAKSVSRAPLKRASETANAARPTVVPSVAARPTTSAKIVATVRETVKSAAETARVAQVAGEVLPKLGVAKAAAKVLVSAVGVPAVPVTAETIAAAKQKVDNLVEARRAATCAAAAQKEVLIRKVEKLDTAVETLGGRLVTALKEGRVQRVNELTTKIDKLDTLRKIAGGRAIRFAKTQAIGAVMTKNAATESNMLAIAGKVVGSDPSAAKVLVAGARAVVAQDKELTQLRTKQVATWAKDTAKDKVAIATALAKEAKAEVAVAQQCCKPASKALVARAQELELRAQGAVDGVWDVVTSAAGSAAGAISKAAKKTVVDVAKKAAAKVGAAVKDGIVAAGKAGANLLKKGACEISKNPAIVQAAVGAVAGVVGGPGAAIKATNTAGKIANNSTVKGLLGTACPSGAAQKVPLPSGGGTATVVPSQPSVRRHHVHSATSVPLTTLHRAAVSGVAAPAKSALPVAAAGIGAAALLFLL